MNPVQTICLVLLIFSVIGVVVSAVRHSVELAVLYAFVAVLFAIGAGIIK